MQLSKRRISQMVFRIFGFFGIFVFLWFAGCATLQDMREGDRYEVYDFDAGDGRGFVRVDMNQSTFYILVDETVDFVGLDSGKLLFDINDYESFALPIERPGLLTIISAH